MSLDEAARAELRDLELAHRLRSPRILDGAQGTHVTLDGIEVINFASNDYLGLASDRRLSQAAATALEEHGTGIGSSRLVIGNHRTHVALETAVADWMQCSGVRLFNSGYAANTGVLAALAGPGDVVFSDELDHASIIDGCRLSRAEIVVFPHRDLEVLERELACRASARRRIVVSESLFSMDGDFADLEGLSALCHRHDAALVIDEAHAIGTQGPQGRGRAAAVGVVPDLVIGTFGKALGSFGAFVVTTAAIADLLWNRARSFVFSTGLPPAVAAASRRAIDLVRGSEGDERRDVLASHCERFRSLVPAAGGAPGSAITPLVVGKDRLAMQLSARLLEERLFVQGIRPPTVPEHTARLRISFSAGHARNDVEKLARTLDDAMRQERRS